MVEKRLFWLLYIYLFPYGSYLSVGQLFAIFYIVDLHYHISKKLCT